MGEIDKTVYGMWFPPDYSVQGASVDLLIDLLHIFMVLLFVGWGLYMIYCLVRFRARPGQKATYQPIKAKLSKYLEIGIVIFEVIILIGLSMPAWSRLKIERPPKADALVVRVIAEQFNWNIHYPGPDGVFGRTKLELMDEETNPIGLDDADPAAEDDITTLNNLYVPKDRDIIIELSSKDVIHSFFIPVMRIKQDAIPGIEADVWFKTAEDAPTGTYNIACSQLCGLGHSTMGAFLHVMEADGFAAWLETAGEEEEFLDEGFDDEDGFDDDGFDE